VSEMFGKHLMQLHGLTAEKATVILDLYPTPNSYVIITVINNLYSVFPRLASQTRLKDTFVNKMAEEGGQLSRWIPCKQKIYNKVTIGPPGGLQISNTRGPPMTCFRRLSNL